MCFFQKHAEAEAEDEDDEGEANANAGANAEGSGGEDDGEELESEDEDEDEDEDDWEHVAMPAKNKQKIPQGKPPSRKSAPASLKGLTRAVGHLTVTDAARNEVFDLNTSVPVMQKTYTKNEVDKYEVEFLCMPFGIEHFQVKLSKCGKKLSFAHACPSFFAEEKRMKAQFGKDILGRSKYNKNDPRVIGHDQCVQRVRLVMGKPRHKVFWGDRPQVVHLPVKVEGPPISSSSLLPVGKISGHTQFLTVITYVYKVAVTKIKREKDMKVIVCETLSSDSEDEDINHNDDDEEEFFTESQVGEDYSMVSPDPKL